MKKTKHNPLINYSKSSAFYTDAKSDFFDANDSLLAKANKQNDFYNKQPFRTQCKICDHTLPNESDFTSHNVSYSFCDNCGHLNGSKEDTKAFVENLYIRSEGEDYAKNYLDSNYTNRAELIYKPKLDFLCSCLPEHTKIKLLDVGCGAGYFVYEALLRDIEAEGIDVSQTMVDFGNQQISHLLKQSPLIHSSEQDFFELIASTDATTISAVGVIEHLRDPRAFFEAFHRSSAEYLYYSVPMFSFSAVLENIFTNIFPRQLSGGHTHLFTEQSIIWLHENENLDVLGEWRFGTDVMDLYRSMRVEIAKKGGSKKLISYLDKGFGEKIDPLQTIFDKNHFCSEIHCLLTKR